MEGAGLRLLTEVLANAFFRRVRQDAILLTGLLLALLAAFLPALQQVFDRVKEAEARSGIAILPALIVLLAALFLQQTRRRQQVATAAATSAADARAMRRRAEELERFNDFERAVAESLDLLTLRQRLEDHLPGMTGMREAWVLLCHRGRWEPVVRFHTSGDAGEPGKLESVASLAAAAASAAGSEHAAVFPIDGHLCFPLRIGDSMAGVLGVANRGDELTEAESRGLQAAAGLIAIGARNVELVAEIRDHGLRDALTGCVNRSHGIETLRVELRRSHRAHSPLSVVMLDLDHFKDVNDRFGHLAGDAVLANAGRVLREALRSSDIKCRYGGEEFLLLLPDTPPDAARAVADMLRSVIARETVDTGYFTVRVTASLGVTTVAPGEQAAEAIIARADQALYAAKHAGRNCVRIAPSPSQDDVAPLARADHGFREAQAPAS